MSLNDKQRLVLTGVLRDRSELAGLDYHGGDRLPSVPRGRYRLTVTHAKQGYVPINLAGWLGRPPTASETVMFCREYQRLEGMGLVERCNIFGGRRTTHLRLTESGERVAKRLLRRDAATAAP